MPKRFIAFAMLSAIMATSACGSSMKKPDIKPNPHPHKRFEITLNIEGAPGPFDSVEADVLLQVVNEDCYPLQPGSGARLPPEKRVPVTLIRIGNKYTGTFYEDQFLDEDYFNMGICHWAINIVGAYLHAGKSSFGINLDRQDLRTDRSNTMRYKLSSYRDERQVFPDEGIPETASAASKSNTFSITFSGKEVSP